MREALSMVAPGRPLREGLDRILQAKMGAIIVVGDDPDVLAICSGGFLLDAEFSPQRMYELAKMDGAIILDKDIRRIARANVHLVPNPSVPTHETGTRHRTAERVARSLDVPVISVSEAMGSISVYRNDQKQVLHTISWLIDRTSQALQTLQRFKQRLDSVTSTLSTVEVEDLVTVRDVVTVLQRAEMVMRIASEVDGFLVELGEDGRLFALQLDELVEGVEQDKRLVMRDYLYDDNADSLQEAIDELSRLSIEDLLDLKQVIRILRLPQELSDLDANLEPRGYRLLLRLPRFPESVIEHIVKKFGTLQHVMRASISELEEVGGVGQARAKSVKDGLARLTEASILERYD